MKTTRRTIEEASAPKLNEPPQPPAAETRSPAMQRPGATPAAKLPEVTTAPKEAPKGEPAVVGILRSAAEAKEAGRTAAVDLSRIAVHPAFDIRRADRVESLNATVIEFVHRATGARHVHVETTDPHNSFLVGFRTVPEDSRGVAHVLEHTVLCGSERYPDRDPFFSMSRRSLNTFMNALTWQDRTAYPFSTQNARDFENLLRVYLDAVFFPRLDVPSFSQEGHRVELENPEDPSSPLLRKGVVFNEMKGAMSPPLRQVSQRLNEALFPKTFYRFNSGGDPKEIPQLTHQQLVDFHKRHYHPSNAIFITYGSLPSVDHQRMLHELALSRFDDKRPRIALPDEPKLAAPVAVEDTYAVDEGTPTAGKTHVVLGWMVGPSTDRDRMAEWSLFTQILIGNAAAPLRHALETAGFGTLSGLTGFDDSDHQASFSCGVEGTEPEKAAAVEQLVIATLKKLATDGVPRAQIDAALHAFELDRRDVSSNRGYDISSASLPYLFEGAEAAETIDVVKSLEKLRERVQDASFVKRLAQELLDNTHRVRLAMRPDPTIPAKERAREAADLAALAKTLTAADRAQLVAQAEGLKKRQEAPPSGTLPRLTVADIPAKRPMVTGEATELAGLPASAFAVETNGIVYERLAFSLPPMDPELVDLLPLFTACLTQVGAGGKSYVEVQTELAAVTGGIGAGIEISTDVKDAQAARLMVTLGGSALAPNNEALARLLKQALDTARFDEPQRLRELVLQLRARAERAVTQSGNMLARMAAASGMNPAAELLHRFGGLSRLATLKRIERDIGTPEGLEELGGKLLRLRDILAGSPLKVAVVADQREVVRAAAGFARTWAERPVAKAKPWEPKVTPQRVRQAWVTDTAVSFCAKAYPTVPRDHADAPALAVLGAVLSSGFLHRAVREQGGAYGGGAAYQGDTASFAFTSYRDPRLAGTLEDFDHAITWVRDGGIDDRLLEEGILSTISGIDTPGSPASEALTTFTAENLGRDVQARQRFRQGVLAVTRDDLKRVAAAYLVPDKASVAVVTNRAIADANKSLGLEVKEL